MKKFIFLIFSIPTLLVIIPKLQNPKLLPEKPNLFEGFEKLHLENAAPLSFNETPPKEEVISFYEPSEPLSIPENFSLIAQIDNKKRYEILPFLDSREDKKSGEIEIFYGLYLTTTF